MGSGQWGRAESASGVVGEGVWQSVKQEGGGRWDMGVVFAVRVLLGWISADMRVLVAADDAQACWLAGAHLRPLPAHNCGCRRGL